MPRLDRRSSVVRIHSWAILLMVRRSEKPGMALASSPEHLNLSGKGYLDEAPLSLEVREFAVSRLECFDRTTEGF